MRALAQKNCTYTQVKYRIPVLHGKTPLFSLLALTLLWTYHSSGKGGSDKHPKGTPLVYGKSSAQNRLGVFRKPGSEALASGRPVDY
jgi:hypothetical protein